MELQGLLPVNKYVLSQYGPCVLSFRRGGGGWGVWFLTIVMAGPLKVMSWMRMNLTALK